MIDDYILHLKATGVKDVTINTYTRGICPIIKYGMDLGLIEPFGFKEIKTTQEIKQVYTEDELKLLLEKPKTQSFTEFRNWVIINFLLATGVRALELRSIRIKHVDIDSGMLLVARVKNKKQRYIPISRKLSEILLEYLDYRKAKSEDDIRYTEKPFRISSKYHQAAFFVLL